MFWDHAAHFYDLFENRYNGEVNRGIVRTVSGMIEPEDRVLECACGTGMISKGIAARCRQLIATDFSSGMLREAARNLAPFKNTKVRRANIMELRAADESFDKVVAGNVVHLLDEPYKAIEELCRVCKKGGKVIIPTYVNKENSGSPELFVRIIEKFGAGFKCQFDYRTYREFFAKGGIKNVSFSIVEGKMPCAIAVIEKK